MVEYRAIERFGSRGEAPSRAAVAVAWARVAARMVMGEDDPGAVALGGIGDDFAEREVRAAFVAVVARHVEAPRLLIDMSDPQAFAERVAVGEATSKEVAGGGEAVKFQWKFGTLIAHAN